MLEVDGIPIAYLDSGGTGPVVVLVHGNSGSADNFSAQFASELATQFRLIAIDLPGHARSGRLPVERYDIPTYANVVLDLVAQLGVKQFVLVGWSLGGHIVLEAAARAKGLLGVMIFGTPPLRCPPNIEEAFLPSPAFGAGMTGELSAEEVRAFAASFVGEPDTALEQVFTREILESDPNARAGLAASVGRPFVDEVELVAGLKVPVAILHGTAEGFANLAYMEALEIPTLWRGKVQIVGGGHAIQLENPARFNQLLRDFVLELAPL